MAGLGLVYGGGGSGLMGVVARAAIARGGHVTGVMPTALVNTEHLLREVSEYHEVKGFHERKMLMSGLSSAFMALPGGPGTLEELIEQLACVGRDIHHKPIYLINTQGYWNCLSDLLGTMHEASPSSLGSSARYVVVETSEEAVDVFLAGRFRV
jgi:hypothetical protein